MTCEDREKKLPAFLEGELPPQESEELKAHLASCATCRSTLDNLKAADHLVRNLGEVEPPLWLKQRIMARVRDAHGQNESLWKKFFFPLHIKIPVQAFAVIVITVLAIYIYRLDEPQIRMRGFPLPPTPAYEVKKEQAVPETRTSRLKTATQSKDMAAPHEALMPAPQPGRTEYGDAYTLLAPSEKVEDTMPTELKRDAREALAETEPALAEKSQAPPSEESVLHSAVKEKRAEGNLPQAIAGAGSRICEQDVCTAEEREGSGAAGFAIAKGTAAKDMPPSLELLLTVKDVASTGVELDKYLATVNARHTEITVHGKQQVLTTEVGSHFVTAFLEKLNRIGILSEYVSPEFSKEAQWVKMKITIMPTVDQNP